MTQGERLKSARQKAGLTQTEVADRLKVDQSQVTRWETDQQSPHPSRMLDLAEILGVKWEDLYG